MKISGDVKFNNCELHGDKFLMEENRQLKEKLRVMSDQYYDWCSRLNYARISMNDKRIRAVLDEIDAHFHVTEMDAQDGVPRFISVQREDLAEVFHRAKKDLHLNSGTRKRVEAILEASK